MNKVLLIDTGKKWGGGQRQTYLLQKYFRKNGIFSATAAPKNSMLYKNLQEEKMESVALPVFFTAYNPETYRRIIRYVKRNNVEILYTQTSNAHTISLVVKIFLKKIKLYVARRVIIPAGKSFFGRIKYNSKLVDGYVAVSNFGAGVLKDSGIPSAKITVVYDGIEHPRPSPEPPGGSNFRKEFGIPDGAPIIGTVGALDKIKDHITFLKAASMVTETAGINVPYFVIVGAGVLRRCLENFAASSGRLRKNVIFTGFRSDVSDIVRNFFLFILTSKSENFCNATLEALSLGVPVIATRVGGIPEQIDDGRNGFLVNTGDYGMIAEKIVYLINNPQKRSEMSMNAGKTAERFSIEKTVKEIIGIFNGGKEIKK